MTASHPRSRTLTLGLIAAVLLPLAIAGTRFEIWPFRLGFLMMIAAAVLGIVTLAILAVGALRPRAGQPQPAGRGWALVLGLVPVVFLANPIYSAATHPVIHDITTDWREPPEFVDVRQLRQGDDHPVGYEGESVAQFQRNAYPDIRPLMIEDAPDAVHRQIRSVLEDMGLEIVADEPADGRIEAVETSLLFGFKDDLVVRIRPEANATRVDLRSQSRIGKSDLGANARRIRHVQRELQARMERAE